MKTIDNRLRAKTVLLPCPNPKLLGQCRVWQGSKSSKGYGRIYFNGRTHQIHRLAYERCGLVIPEGMQLDHLCRVRACWNPDHIEPVTNKQNVLRGVGISAQFAQRDRCKNGHIFTSENVIMRTGKRTGRRCLDCSKDWVKRRSEMRSKRRQSNALQSS
jgi:hypothetical protein